MINTTIEKRKTPECYADEFTDRYPVTKTLGFKLVPVMGTEQRIKEHKVLESDAQLADSYKKMKATGDEFHKAFIQTVLENAEMPPHYEEYCSLLKATREEKAMPSYRRDLNKANAALKAEISGQFRKDPCYAKLFKKEFFSELLPKFVEGREDLFFDESFKKRTTDFSDYHKTRENFYAPDGSIVRRIVDDNIPKHLTNIVAFSTLLASEAADCVNRIEKELSGILNGATLADWFREDTLVWSQEAIETCNALIGGIMTADRHIKGLNNYVSEYNQTHTEKLMFFSKMYKMVMSDRVRLSWLPDAFTTEEEVIKAISEFHRTKLAADNYAVRTVIHKMFADAAVSGSTDRIYYSGKELHELSNELFGQASVIRYALEHYYVNHKDLKFEDNFAKASEQKQEKMLAVKRKFTAPKQISLALLDDVLLHYADECDSSEAKKVAKQYQGIMTLINTCIDNVEACMASADESYRTVEEKYGHSSFNELKPTVKKYLDSVLNIHRQLRCFSITDPSLEFDTAFYAAHDEACECLGTCVPLYNMVRNYATKKPFSTAKTNLTFGKVGTFLGGWVDSHGAKSDNGTASGGYLFRKKNAIGEYDYYLGVSVDPKLFRTGRDVEEQDKSEFERLEYYQLSNKSFYGKAYDGSYKADSLAAMQAIRAFVVREKGRFDEATHGMLMEYLSSAMATPMVVIKRLRNNAPDAYKRLLEDPDFSEANQLLSQKLLSLVSIQSRLDGTGAITKKTYEVYTDIMADIEELTRTNRTFRYHAISKKEMELALANELKPLYLFKITNQDLSYAETFTKGLRKSRGRDSLHTMIFKALMSGEQGTYDIGTGKVFYRPASIPERDTHPANVPIRSKTKRDKTNTFTYAIQKDRRYMKDMFSFQLSVICNYSAAGDTNINKDMLEYLTRHPDVNIIGVNRGEYNLLYVTVIDQQGNILRDKDGKLLSYPLNTIVSNYKDAAGRVHTVEKSYRDVLDEREKQRLEERQNWEDVSKIKDIKAGYLSQVVHHLTSLMMEYNAVLVLEDLENRFVQKRTAIEKSIYGQFEKALITKLNFFFRKDVDPNEPGGLFNPYQLTAPLKAMKDIHAQTGCIFYVSPWMVTRLDPATGFTDMLYVNTDAPVKTYKTFFEKMLGIRYNPDKKWFEFHVDYRAYDALMPDDIRTEWTICTHSETRWAYDKKMNNNKGGYRLVQVTDELGELLKAEGISYEDGHDLKADILNRNSRKFFTSLYKLLKLVTQLHYRAKDDIDVLISPVAKADGTFFRSDAGLSAPNNGDANASYNIARKALFGIRNLDPESPWFRTPGKYDWIRFIQDNRIG